MVNLFYENILTKAEIDTMCNQCRECSKDDDLKFDKECSLYTECAIERQFCKTAEKYVAFINMIFELAEVHMKKELKDCYLKEKAEILRQMTEKGLW